MPSLSSPTTGGGAAAATAGGGYTTIPISGTDAITRSIQNLSSSFSAFRPPSEFLPVAAPGLGLSPPASLAAAKLRLRRNAGHFRLNYAVLAAAAAFLAVLFSRSPLSLLLLSATAFLWLVLYFFREDPLVAYDRDVSDTAVLAALVAVSVVELWLTGCFWSLVSGAAAGAAVAAVHGLLRNEEGVYLDEQEAASWGLIGSNLSAGAGK